MGTIWNSGNEIGSWVLSGSNLIATSPAGAAGIASTTWRATGKWYWEVNPTGRVDNPAGAACAPTSISLTNGIDRANVFGYSFLETNGGVMGFALDLDTQLFWQKNVTAGTDWNLTASASPGGTGGKSFAQVSTGNVFIMWAGDKNTTNDAATLNTGASAFALTAPSGFNSWDTSGNTTWNPSDKNANVVLTGSNLVATQSGVTSTWAGVRSTTSQSSGKWYFEVGITTYDGGNGWLLGVAKSTQSLANGNYPGATTDSAGYQIGFNATYQLGGGGTNLGTTGTIGVALDLDPRAKKIWTRSTGNANWNNNGSANPATGVGGYTLPSAGFGVTGGFPLGSTAWQITAYTPTSANQVFTLNVGGSAFTGIVPTGYMYWDQVLLTGGRKGMPRGLQIR